MFCFLTVFTFVGGVIQQLRVVVGIEIIVDGCHEEPETAYYEKQVRYQGNGGIRASLGAFGGVEPPLALYARASRVEHGAVIFADLSTAASTIGRGARARSSIAHQSLPRTVNCATRTSLRICTDTIVKRAKGFVAALVLGLCAE